MGTKLSDLTEATSLSLTDLFHIRTAGGVDKKINKGNVFATLFIGLNNILLTEYYTTTIPQIAAGGSCEINGKIYFNTGNINITGVTVNSNWYDILLTPSGDSYTASFIADGTGVWSDSKQGLYSGNNRVIGRLYRDGSGDYIHKNILHVINREVIFHMNIGDWNMNSVSTINFDIFMSVSNYDYSDIVSFSVVIKEDSSGDNVYNLNTNQGDQINGYSLINVRSSNTSIDLYRTTGGFFDSVDFDQTSYNRGFITIKFKV